MVACTLCFDASIMELFKTCLVMDQTPGQGTLSKMFFDVLGVRWGVSLAWGPSEYTSKEV